MYALLGIDAVLRIVAALLLLFVVVPALAVRRPASLNRLQWFWWCFAAGTVVLTLVGQALTLLNVHSGPTLVLVLATLVVVVRARTSHTRAAALIHDAYRAVVFVTLKTLEGRVHLRRRVRRAMRATRKAIETSFATPRARWAAAGWSALVALATATRLYRPFATANLGYSDTYVHLYLVRLLEQGRQVDPAWGPYPRGMHFLLLSIHELTNVDEILLMNFFGAVAGVLLAIAVADAARRLVHSLPAGLLAGAVFATMIGGASQYFLLGGSFVSGDTAMARAVAAQPYAQVVAGGGGEFDILLTAFQRQTSTLPQELAIVFLFPAALFLLDWFRSRDGWQFAGFIACSGAIAAVHPGVAVPLVVLCAVSTAAALADRTLDFRSLRTAALAGAAGIAVGSSWMIAFIAYPHVKASLNAEAVGSGANVASTALYYFPLLRGLAGDPTLTRIRTWVPITTFLLVALAVAAALLLRSLFVAPPLRGSLVWTAGATLAFFVTHTASRFGLPELVEVRRNATWLAMALAILIGVAVVELARAAARLEVRLPARPVLRPLGAALLIVLWMARVPLFGSTVRDQLVNYSGYGATAYAVLAIEHRLEPFTWTLVTYGQEYPMVLGRGFHLAAAEFLDHFDPSASPLRIPTRYVFIAVEKTPHRFEISNWARQFSRADLEQRLQTWCFLYQLSHRDMRVWLDDENVRVYVIERTQDEANRVAREGAAG